MARLKLPHQMVRPCCCSVILFLEFPYINTNEVMNIMYYLVKEITKKSTRLPSADGRTKYENNFSSNFKTSPNYGTAVWTEELNLSG
jgi:hypothetical protein